MKVILAAKSIYPFHPVGGVQKHAYYLAKFLTKNNIDVEIVARLDKKGKPRREKIDGITYTLIRPAIYRYIEYPVGWIGVHLFSWSLAKYLQKKEFDVLHAFDFVTCFVRAALVGQPIDVDCAGQKRIRQKSQELQATLAWPPTHICLRLPYTLKWFACDGLLVV